MLLTVIYQGKERTRNMRLIKRQSKATYVSKRSGKECHYYNYFIEFDNKKRVQINANFKEDVRVLDVMAIFEGTNGVD